MSITGAACGSSCPTTPTRFSCFTSRRIATPYFRLVAGRRVIQTDRRRWDYKHQVLATRDMSPWRVLLWFKFTAMVLQCWPRAIWRVYFQRDARLRHAMRWYTQMGRRVWPYEILNFLRDRLVTCGPTVAELWGALQDKRGRIDVGNPARVSNVAARRGLGLGPAFPVVGESSTDSSMAP
jgi:hypothetical protein